VRHRLFARIVLESGLTFLATGKAGAIASLRRAAAAERRSDARFDVELRPLAELSVLADEWRALGERALEPNAFYDPAFALAAAPVLGADVLAGLVWSRSPRKLAGFFPVRIERRRYGLPLAMLVGWTHPFAPIGTPLADRDMAEPAVAAWLDYVASDPTLPKLMLMPLLAEVGPVASCFAAVLAQHNIEPASFGRHERALLSPGESRSDYLKRRVSGKRLRNLRRRRQQLAERDAVAVTVARGGEELARAQEDYLAIEAGGWKGRAGTAVAQNQDISHFMRSAVTALGRENKVLIHRLMLGGKPIAATMALQSCDTVWGWKVSYDEAYADYSPGVLAVAGLTETLLEDPAIRQADSCASPNDSMAPQLWSERITIADWLFSVDARADFAFSLASRLEALRRAAIRAAKSARDHLRRR
jgi:CelD/BcsL family acetyltransferase involved in cellulose biosynthesis